MSNVMRACVPRRGDAVAARRVKSTSVTVGGLMLVVGPVVSTLRGGCYVRTNAGQSNQGDFYLSYSEWEFQYPHSAVDTKPGQFCFALSYDMQEALRVIRSLRRDLRYYINETDSPERASIVAAGKFLKKHGSKKHDGNSKVR